MSEYNPVKLIIGGLVCGLITWVIGWFLACYLGVV